MDVSEVRTDLGSSRPFALIYFPVGDPAGPGSLLAAPRHDDRWFVPSAGEVLRIVVWAVADRAAAWAHLDARTLSDRSEDGCSLATDEQTARRIARGALGAAQP